MLLYWLTLIVVAAMVVALAGYLIAITWALLQAQRNVAKLADGLEVIAGHTDPLEEKVGTIAGALKTLVAGFKTVDEQLAGATKAFER